MTKFSTFSTKVKLRSICALHIFHGKNLMLMWLVNLQHTWEIMQIIIQTDIRGLFTSTLKLVTSLH